MSEHAKEPGPKIGAIQEGTLQDVAGRSRQPVTADYLSVWPDDFTQSEARRGRFGYT
jgi:hypothetical protein